MFIFVEFVFLLVLDKQFELIIEVLKNNIMLVSFMMLLVVLWIIVNLWCYEYQSCNVQYIVDRVSKFYDKMWLFVDDMLVIGQSLDKVQDNYCQVMKKFVLGCGNVLVQVEVFRGLGVEIKCEINLDLVEQVVM